MHYVYVLRSLRDGNFYTGVTNDLKRRLGEHQAGKTRSLRARRPLQMVYKEAYRSRSEALARERFFKTPAGGVLKQRLVAEALRNEQANAEGWQSGRMRRS